MGKQSKDNAELKGLLKGVTDIEGKGVAQELLDTAALSRVQVREALGARGIRKAEDFKGPAVGAFRTLLKRAVEIGGDNALAEFKSAAADRPTIIPIATDADVKAAAQDAVVVKEVEEAMRSGQSGKGARSSAKGRGAVHSTGRASRE